MAENATATPATTDTAAPNAASTNSTQVDNAAAQQDKLDEQVLSRLARKAEASDTAGEPEEAGEADELDADAARDGVADEPAKGSKDGDGKADSEGGDVQPPEGFDKALRAMRRAGFFDTDDELMEAYRANPEKFIARGLKQAKVQADQDTLGNELAAARRQAAGGQNKGTDAKTGTDATPAASAAGTGAMPADIEQILAGIKNAGYDDEIVGGLKKMAESILQQAQVQAQTKFTEELGARDRLIDRLVAQTREQQFEKVNQDIEATRRELMNEYPELKDADVHEQALAQYDILEKTGGYKTAADIYRDAVKLKFADAAHDRIKTQLLGRNKTRRAGTVRAQSGTGVDRSKLTQDERDSLLLKELERKHGMTQHVDMNY